jgi:glycosyltransferase involved in cell wall biosynthesis
MPRVTLAMPVYNGQNFIEQAIQSILNQDFADFELIITDNASTDGTQEIVRRFAKADPRVRYHRHSKNLGAAPNYNSGFELASPESEYLKWCAHDDCISANYLTECVQVLDGDPGVSLAFGRTQCIDDDGREIATVGHELPSLDGLSAADRFGKVIGFAGTCFEIFGVYRMSDLRRTTLHRLYYGSDRALLAEIALFGKYARCNDAVFYNREHRSRSINIDDKRTRRQWQFADGGDKASFEHWGLISHLFEIARRHPDVAPTSQNLWQVARFAMQPMQLSRYCLELVGAVSPSMQRWIRRQAFRPLKA